jgi:DNA-binding phage protein
MSTIFEEEEIFRMLRSDIKEAGGQSAWARKHRLDRTLLNKVLQGRNSITPSIAKALNLRRVYIRD